MRSGKYVRILMMVISLVVISTAAYPSPGPEAPAQPELPDHVREMAEILGRQTVSFGFGFFVDVPEKYMESGGKQLQVELIKLKSTKESNYLTTSLSAFDGAKYQINLPGYVLFNLDIYYGEPGEENIEDRTPFAVSRAYPGITIYFLHQELNHESGRALQLFHWVGEKDGPDGRWFSQQDAAAVSIKEPDGFTMSKEFQMDVTELYSDEELGVSWFTIYRWPADDRVICADG